MTMTFIDPAQLRTRGFEALVQSLGWVNAVRFVQQYESSTLNYTQKREGMLPELDPAELVRQLRAMTLKGS